MEHTYYSDQLIKPMKNIILWIDYICLTDSSCYIYGSFNFDSRSEIIKPKQYIILNHWEFLFIT